MFFAIPFFNNSKYLRETLESLTFQNDPHWNAIVLDDSIDPLEARGAQDCVDLFRDPRIIYQKNSTNFGMAKNWNQTFELSGEHDLAVILHADDRLKPDYVLEMKRLAIAYPDAVGFFCKTEIIGPEGSRAFSLADFYKTLLLPGQDEIVLSGVEGIKALIPGNFIFCPSIAYRVQKIAHERFNDQFKMVMDFDFILRLLEKGETWVGYYGHSLFQYRRHTRNATVKLTQNLTRFHEEIELYKNLSRTLLNLKQPELARLAKKMRVVKLNLGFQILKSIFTLRMTEVKKEVFLLKEIL